MSRKLPFVKYTCYGNNFVILDETQGKLLSERELSRFADQATDVNFGVGADNLLVIQPCTPEVLQDINSSFAYWNRIPTTGAQYVFRMFEPNGDEALCCGNGLMCIAHYLAQEYNAVDTSIMTEAPLDQPTRTPIGSLQDASRSWVNLGTPRKLPDAILGSDAPDEYEGNMQIISDLLIKFRLHDLSPYSDKTELLINGYVIFTGEPHMVIFLEQGGVSVPGLTDVVFADSEGNRGAGPIFRQRIRFGTWLLDRVGYYVNTHYRDMFPIGMNVNFVRLRAESNTVEYRCFERGINKETLACGTGAMAVAYVTSEVMGMKKGDISVLPHRCRWFKKDADIHIRSSEEGWTLSGQPKRVMEAVFLYD